LVEESGGKGNRVFKNVENWGRWCRGEERGEGKGSG